MATLSDSPLGQDADGAEILATTEHWRLLQAGENGSVLYAVDTHVDGERVELKYVGINGGTAADFFVRNAWSNPELG